MHVTPQENDLYRAFVSDVARELGVFEVDPSKLVWHYTNGAGLLGILQSASIFATQVSALNDSKETEYATDLYKTALNDLIKERDGEPEAVEFLKGVLEFVKGEPEVPTLGISKFFVSCFSGEEDDVNQWFKYAKGDGRYAIGFHPWGLNREPNSTLLRVIYDREKQVAAAKKVAEATLHFYIEGFTDERKAEPEKWARVFFEAWDEWVYKLAPLAKDPMWWSENEFRIVHELKVSEFPRVRFSQKQTMMSRYLPLDFHSWMKRRASMLPIGKIMIGPGTHPTFTRVSIMLLLEQMGYENVLVESSKCTLTDR
jgi:hypothetical protein